jgi:WD40 repeat protein
MVYGVAFGPNAKRVASVGGGFDPTIRIWEIPDSENGK